MKIEFTTTAYIPRPSAMTELLDSIKAGDNESAGDALAFSKVDMTGMDHWSKVGVAHITVELLDPKEMQNEQLAALQAQLQKERADSQMRQNAILDRISKLQALEWEGGVA